MGQKRKLSLGSPTSESPPPKSRRKSPSESSDLPSEDDSHAPEINVPKSVDGPLSDFESDASEKFLSFDLPERVPLPSRVLARQVASAPDALTIAEAEPPTNFGALGISPSLCRALRTMSIKAPTPVQISCIPPLLSGRDCIGNAKTGSGKTVAFALPILQKLTLDPYGIFALVLTPTRELAFQIADQFAVLGAPLNIRTSVVIGGMDMMTQALELKNRPHVVVATPGRLVDHMNSEYGEWDLSRVKFLILDEADRLLTSSFSSDLQSIFAAIPSERQTGLFTATLTPSIERLADATPRPGKQKPVVYRDTSTVETVETLNQYFLLVPSHVREVYIYYLLRNPPESVMHLRREPPPTYKPKRRPNDEDDDDDEPAFLPPPTIIFVTHPRTAAYLTTFLQHLNIQASALHSHLSQPARLASLQLFRSSIAPVLICTDVASRGLDIEGVGMVINWDMPIGKLRKKFLDRQKARHTQKRSGKRVAEPPVADKPVSEESEDEDDVGGAEEYVHRVGRTARMGRGGVAISFVTEREEDATMVLKIEERIRTKLTEMELPEEKVLQDLSRVSTAKRTARLALQDSNMGERQRIHRMKRG